MSNQNPLKGISKIELEDEVLGMAASRNRLWRTEGNLKPAGLSIRGHFTCMPQVKDVNW